MGLSQPDAEGPASALNMELYSTVTLEFAVDVRAGDVDDVRAGGVDDVRAGDLNAIMRLSFEDPAVPRVLSSFCPALGD